MANTDPGKRKRGKKAAVAFNNPFRFKGGTPPITPIVKKNPLPPVVDDGTYTVTNSKSKITTKYNADGTKFRKAGKRKPLMSLQFPSRAKQK